MKKNLIFLFFILCVAFLVRMPGLREPFECDQANYGYIALNWEQGKLPYAGLWDNKPPMIYLFYRLIYRVFGYSDLAVHFGFAILAVFSVFVFYLLCRKLFETRFALLAALLYGIFSSGGFISGNFGVTENIMVFFTIASFYFLFLGIENGKGSLFLLSGLAMGFSMMSKQAAMWELLAAVVFLFLPVCKIDNFIRRLKYLALFLSGVMVVFSSIFGYFVIMGAGREFIQETFLYNLFFGRIVGIRQGLVNFLNALSWSPRENFMLWGLALLGLARAAQDKRGYPVFLVFWFFASALGVISSLRFYPHYFIQIIPVLVMLFVFYLSKNKKESTQAVAVAVSVALFLAAQLPFYFSVSPVDSLIQKRKGLIRPQLQYALPAAAAFIRKNTSPEDMIYVWGLWPEVYFYTKRPAASGYFYISGRGTMLGKFKEELQRQVAFDIMKNRPKYIIIDPHYSGLVSGPLLNFIKSAYTLDFKLGGCSFLRRTADD
ncbi:MAG: glycosyltransferase family 39 protein [Candidatus Omnitrophica bacterium]|nr:glycosyltransferase family 39 protein [Candidatus Omnitrophota bacterium]